MSKELIAGGKQQREKAIMSCVTIARCACISRRGRANVEPQEIAETHVQMLADGESLGRMIRATGIPLRSGIEEEMLKSQIRKAMVPNFVEVKERPGTAKRGDGIQSSETLADDA